MSERKDKFIKRNQKHVDELISKIKKHEGNVRCLIMPTELVGLPEYFDEIVQITDNGDSLDGTCVWEINGTKIIVILNVFFPSDIIQIILKDDNENKVKLDVPCICGYYSDEEHGHLLN